MKNKKIQKQVENDKKRLEKKYSKYSDLFEIRKVRPESFDVLVTIYCTCFNHEKFLRRSLDSILSQRVNFGVEIIIHDDASKDDSQNIILEYKKKYPKIIKAVLQKENQYSKGIRIFPTFIKPLVKGKYIAFCETDDWWDNDYKLIEQVTFLENNEDYIGVGHETIINDNRNGLLKKYANYNKDCDVLCSDAIIWGHSKKVHTSSRMIRSCFVFVDKPDFCKCYVGDHSELIYYTFIGKFRFLNIIMSTYNMYGSVFSWRSTTFSSSNNIIESIKKRIKMFELFNNYSEKKYDYIVNRLILRDKGQIMLYQERYKELLAKENVMIFRNLERRQRFYIVAKTHFPFLFAIKRFLKGIKNEN